MTITLEQDPPRVSITHVRGADFQREALRPEAAGQDPGEREQEIAELVTISEMQIGRMLKEIPKASGGDRKSDSFKNHSEMKFETKKETIKDLGFTPKQTAQFQQMADHESDVYKAISEARPKRECRGETPCPGMQ